MGELGALFNPGMRHEIEERQSKASRREEEGQADPGNLRIDLLSGVAVINMGNPATEKDDVSESDNPDGVDDNTDDLTDDLGSTDDPDATEESVQSSDEDSAESTRAPAADTGTAPAHRHGTNASADDEVNQDALDIARGSSNAEPPA